MSVANYPIILHLLKDGYVTTVYSRLTLSSYEEPFNDIASYHPNLCKNFDEFYVNGWVVSEDPLMFNPLTSILYISAKHGDVINNNIRTDLLPMSLFQGDIILVEHQLYYSYSNERYYHLWRVGVQPMTPYDPVSWYRFDVHWDTIPWDEKLTKTTLTFNSPSAGGEYPIAAQYYDSLDPNFLILNFNSSPRQLTIAVSDSETSQLRPYLVISPVSSLGLSDKEIIAESINSVVSDYNAVINTKINNLSKIYQR